MHHIHEVSKTAAKAIQLPHNERVTLPESLEACCKSRSVVFLTGGGIAIEVALRYACRQERVPLQVEHLRAISLRHSHVPNERRGNAVPQTAPASVLLLGAISAPCGTPRTIVGTNGHRRRYLCRGSPMLSGRGLSILSGVSLTNGDVLSTE